MFALIMGDVWHSEWMRHGVIILSFGNTTSGSLSSGLQHQTTTINTQRIWQRRSFVFCCAGYLPIDNDKRKGVQGLLLNITRRSQEQAKWKLLDKNCRVYHQNDFLVDTPVRDEGGVVRKHMLGSTAVSATFHFVLQAKGDFHLRKLLPQEKS